jgi:hypothetical protein
MNLINIIRFFPLKAFLISGIGIILLMTGSFPVIATNNSGVDKPEYYRYSAALPENPEGYWLVVKPYLKDLNPDEFPSFSRDTVLSAFATPGELQPVTFVIYATKDLEKINVSVTDLSCEGNIITADNLKIRTVMRAPQLKNYWSDPDEFVITNRFLPEFEPFDLSVQHLREIWITVDIPEKTLGGMYTGRVEITTENGNAQSLPFELKVLPFKLKVPTSKLYGMYYYVNVNGVKKPMELIKNELRDIRAHHGTIVLNYYAMQVDYKNTSSGYIPDYQNIKKYLDLFQQTGFTTTTAVINTGFERLVEKIIGNHPDNAEDYQKWIEKVKESDELSSVAKKALDGLADLQSEYPNYTFVMTHMDEVFNRSELLPLYIALSELVREHSDFPLYITVNTSSESKMKEIDEYVDIRGHHGYDFEQWLSKGHTIEEYQQELQQSGDVAWQYHNPICWFINSKWQRLINGLYMWVAPFEARVDYIYNTWTNNPLNDLDVETGDRWNGWNHDYGFAFPLPGTKAEIIPTRNWEGWREGIEDLWYLYTLEQLIAESPQLQVAQNARQWLLNLRESYPDFQETEIGNRGTPKQSPIIYAMDQTFDIDDLENIRYTAARYILELQK